MAQRSQIDCPRLFHSLRRSTTWCHNLFSLLPAGKPELIRRYMAEGGPTHASCMPCCRSAYVACCIYVLEPGNPEGNMEIWGQRRGRALRARESTRSVKVESRVAMFLLSARRVENFFHLQKSNYWVMFDSRFCTNCTGRMRKMIHGGCDEERKHGTYFVSSTVDSYEVRLIMSSRIYFVTFCLWAQESRTKLATAELCCIIITVTQEIFTVTP